MRINNSKIVFPYSNLNFIWGNRTHEKRILDSPYTKLSKMVIVESGNKKSGQWIDEDVNALKEYIDAFGENPPTEVAIAVMCDSDNTGEKGEGYIDFIEVANE